MRELNCHADDNTYPGGFTCIKENANHVKPSWFKEVTNKNNDGSKMLVCDGMNSSDFKVWIAENIPVQAGMKYEFSCNVANVDNQYNPNDTNGDHGPNSRPQLRFWIEQNGTKTQLAEFTVEHEVGKFQLFIGNTYTAPTTGYCTIYIQNYTTFDEGNDFAIDDIYFGEPQNSTNTKLEAFEIAEKNCNDTKTIDHDPEVKCPSQTVTLTCSENAPIPGITWSTGEKDTKTITVTSSSTENESNPDIYTCEYTIVENGINVTYKETFTVKTKDCSTTETITHLTIIVCPDTEVELESDKEDGGTWSHDASKTDNTITVKSNSTVGQIDTYTYKTTVTDASGNTVTYVETFPVETKDCSGTEDSKTHQIKEGDTITLIIPENKRCDDCTYRWYRINENGESEEILGLEPKNPTYTPSSAKDGDKYYGEVIDNDNNVKHTQYLKIETYRETTYTVCYDVNNDAPQTKTITGAKADDEWYQWLWIKDGNPIEFPEGTITTEGENITFNLEYFVNDNNGTLPTEIHILEKYGVKTEPVEPNDPNSNGTTEPDGDIGGSARNFGINCDDFISEDGNLSYNSSTRILGDESKGSYIVIGSNYEYADEFPSKNAGMSKHKGVIRVTTQGMGNSTPDLSENSENTYFIEVDGGDVVGEVFSVHSNMKINRGEKYIFSLKARTTSIIEGILTDSPAELDFFIIINNNKQKLNTNTEIINHAAWQKYEYEYTAEEDSEGLIIMISDNNNKSDMNDFALDDMSFYQMQGGTVSERSAYRSLYRSATAQAEAEDEFNENGNQVYKDEFYLIINPVTYQFVEEAAAPSREYEAEVKLTHNANNEYLTFFYDPNISYVEGMTKYEDKKVATNLYGCPHEVYFTLNLIAIEPEIFFSPNEDGVNDRWMIKGIESAPNAHIMIYDRHSKLLYKSVGSEFTGWDGNYNGHGMVQDDYWYVIQIPETNETLSGHFILKR